MESKKFFYLSGIFSLLIYGVIIFLIFVSINLKGPERFIVKQDTQYDTALIEDVLIEDTKVLDRAQPDQIPQDQEMKEEESKSQPAPSLRDIFSSIPNLDKEQEEKREEEEKRKREIRQKEREEIRNQQEQIRKLQSNLQDINKTLERLDTSIDITPEDALPNQDKGRYDEWIAEIYKILYRNWNFSFYQETSISVMVEITNQGHFSYSILRYSQYDEYNEQIKELLDHLRSETFPPYPNGKSFKIEVNFKSKERNE